MDMAQVRKYQNAAGPLPKKKWSYKGKEYEVDDEDLKMLNDWKMSNYEFDENLPKDYKGVPSGKDVLAKKYGLITEDQYNAKYNPTSTSTLTSTSEPILASVVVADKTPKSEATPEKKYGRFFRGSSSLEGKRAYDALFDANRNAGGWGMTNMALKAVEAGHDVYRGSDGSIVIKDSNGNDITEQFIPKGVNATTEDSRFRRNLGATFNSRNNQYRISGEYLDDIDMTPEEKPDNRIELRRGSGWFTPTKDENGNEVYDIKALGNSNNEQTIREIIDYALGNKTDMDAKYKHSAWSDADIAKLREYSDELAAYNGEDGNNTYADTLIEAIRSGNLTEDQMNFLSLMGFDKNGTRYGTESEDGSENPFQLEGVDSELLKSYGITGITKNIDENGNEYWTVEGDDKFKNQTWDLQGFGDIFGKFSGGWLYGGRLYEANDHIPNRSLGNAVRTYLGNNADNINDWWTAAKQSGVRFYGDENESAPFINFNTAQNYDRSTEGLVWDFLRNNKLGNKNIGIREVTSAYDPSKLNGRRIFAYVDTSDITNRNGHRPLIKYFDNLGNIVDIKSLGEELQFPGTNTTDFVFSNLDTSGTATNNMFTHGTYTSNDGVQLTVLRDLNGGYHIYRDNNKPISIDPSRITELMEMIKGGNWKWKNVEGLNKPKKVKSDKEGGTINWNRLSKLAPGGYISNTRQNVEIDNSKVSDITKPHALDSSNGGLTKAETLQLMGALADLGGVTASFAPGLIGGITGGLTGLAGTSLKLAGDIKRDGFDWGDVGRGLTNFAFDVAAVPASFLPGGDNAIKVSKFTRTIKSIGQPLLKWMGTMNFGSALINTASKIINGEKYTADDAIQLAQGLAGGIVAGKQWGKQIGDAKLAAKLSGRAATKANTSFNKNVVINKDTNQTITTDELETIVKNANGNEAAIREALKNKGASENISLESLGITKGRRNPIEWATRKPKKSIYEKPTEQEGNSFWHYFVNGSERAQALGADKMFGQKKHNNLLDNISEREYQLLMARGAGSRNSTISSATRRAALNNPKRFNFKFDGVKTVVAPGQFGRRNQYRKVAEPKTSTTNQQGAKQTSYIAPKIASVPIEQSSYIATTPLVVKSSYTTPTSITIDTSLPPISALTPFARVAAPTSVSSSTPTSLVPVGNRTLTTTNSALTPVSTFKAISPKETSVAPYEQIQYKSTNTGNKRSFKFDINSIPKQNTLLGLEQLGKSAEFKEWANSNPKEARKLIAGLRSKFTNARYKNASTAEKDAYFNSRVNEMKSRFGWRFKKGGSIPMMRDGWSGGLPGKKQELNLGNPADWADLAQGISSQIALNEAYKHDVDAINALKKYREQAVRFNAPTLDINDISHKYNTARNTLKSSIGPNTSTDLTLQSAKDQAYGQALVNLDMQEGGEKSNRIMQNKAEYNDIANQNIANAIGTANRNLDRATQLNYQTEALKGQKIRDEQANVWQPLSQQFRQQFRDMINKKASIQQQIELDDLQQRQLLDDKTGIYKEVYEMYNKSGSPKTFFDWLASNDVAYKRYLEIRDSEKGMKREAAKRKERYDIYNKYLKSGGSIDKRKTVQEEIAINNNKMSKEAVQKMNDNLTKILLQLLK